MASGFLTSLKSNLMLLLFFMSFFFLAAHHGMRDLSSPTRDQTCTPCSGSMESSPLDHPGSPRYTFFLNKFIYFIYLLLAALVLCCCARAFSSCGERGLLFVAVHGLLIAVASLVAEHGL